jgi:hypothetical protein
MVPLLMANTAAPSRTPFSDWKAQNQKDRPLQYMIYAEESSSSLSMETACFNETLVTTYQITRRHISENCCHNHRHGNLELEI